MPQRSAQGSYADLNRQRMRMGYPNRSADPRFHQYQPGTERPIGEGGVRPIDRTSQLSNPEFGDFYQGDRLRHANPAGRFNPSTTTPETFDASVARGLPAGPPSPGLGMGVPNVPTQWIGSYGDTQDPLLQLLAMLLTRRNPGNAPG